MRGLDLREVFLPSCPEPGPDPVHLVFCTQRDAPLTVKTCGQRIPEQGEK